MNQKIRAAILFGGKSAEHEISLISGQNIIRALDRDKYEPVLIGIDKSGAWYLQEEAAFLAKADDPKTIRLTDFSQPLALIPGEKVSQFFLINNQEALPPVDVVFPILHGPLGEDGAVQGLLQHLHLPYVGPDVLASAICMDKEVAKRLLRDAGIPNSKFLVFHREELGSIDFEAVERELGLPMYVKPANLGSSVGISRVRTREEFAQAIQLAFNYDRKLLIEQNIKGREIECAVLGNEFPKGSIPGEVVPQDGFYSYEAKYLDEKGARLELPAPGLDAAMVERIQQLATKTFKTLCCEGLARVDFFLKENGELYVNEVNTLPGFTKISMYPSLWGISGVPYPELIDQLLQFAMDRFQQQESLNTEQAFK